ncbi:carbon-nitrogen family hydrolase [bacterium 1xD8-48]|nr:carbon-nitrogen family hydrolase [bacterium 1xD8-48]
MKVALAQTNIIWEDKAKNEQRAIEYISQAANCGVQAIFFPEMSLTGFSMNTKLTAEMDKNTVHRFCNIAVQYNIAIGIGWVKKSDCIAENHYTVISGKGEELSDYIKIHPFSYAGENIFFSAGSEITLFELGNYKWSSFICYDLRFPEIFQIASRTAEVIVIPANWPKQREEHWKCLLKARAIENQCFVLGVNCVGNINNIEYGGSSCAISPDGKIVGCFENREGILIFDLEENVKELREKFSVKKDRKWDLYISKYKEEKGKD